MSLKPAKNPVPRDIWQAIKKTLAEHGVAIQERQIAILDKVGDEYATLAVLYVKEQ